MKSYKSTLLFGLSFLVITGIILTVNRNLGKILPDYQNEVQQYEVSLPSDKENQTSSASGDWVPYNTSNPEQYTIFQLAEFFDDPDIWNQVYETAEVTMNRSKEPIPSQCAQMLENWGYRKTVSSSIRKTIQGKLYFKMVFEIEKNKQVQSGFLLYAQDGEEIYYFANSAPLSFAQPPAELTNRTKKEAVIQECQERIAATNSSLLQNFQPANVRFADNNIYILRDDTNRITIEYNADKKEILAYMIGGEKNL